MLVSHNAPAMKQGDVVLIWGATGGLGGYAVQYVLNGGGTPVGVVSSATKVELLHELGCEHVIDRKEAGYQFWYDEHTQDEKEWRRLGKDIRGAHRPRRRHRVRAPRPPDHRRVGVRLRPRRQDRHLRGHPRLHDRVRQPPPLDEAEEHRQLALRQLPGGVGGQPARSARARSSRSSPPCTRSTDVGEAAYAVHQNLHEGKIGVLCLAPEEGLGIDDPELPREGRRGQDHAVPPARRLRPGAA